MTRSKAKQTKATLQRLILNLLEDVVKDPSTPHKLVYYTTWKDEAWKDEDELQTCGQQHWLSSKGPKY